MMSSIANGGDTPMMPHGRFAIIIPVFNHARQVVNVVTQACRLNLPVIVVDDGSTDGTYARLTSIPNIHLLRHTVNLGKGAAIQTGFKAAAAMADWAITIDADGQHHPEDTWNVMRAIPFRQRPIIVGARTGMATAHVPWTSRFGRGFSNFWVWVAGGPRLTDSQSGFRAYPIPEVTRLDVSARRYQFEIEILVKAHLNHIRIVETPVRVTYPPGEERVSHFRPFIDFMRNSQTFSRLIFRRVVHFFSINSGKIC